MSRTTERRFALSLLLARDPEARDFHQGHLLVLEFICARPEPVTAIPISLALDVSQSQLSRLLGKLEDRGLISRTNHRPATIVATEPGKALIRRIHAYVAACLSTSLRTAA